MKETNPGEDGKAAEALRRAEKELGEVEEEFKHVDEAIREAERKSTYVIPHPET